MREQDRKNGPEDLCDPIERLLQEHRERMAVIRETKFEVEPHPGLQRLAETQPEFRDRMMSRLRRLLYG